MLEVTGLKKYYTSGIFFKHIVKAVDGVSFTIAKGETFGLVGESGSGKSTIGLCLIRLIEPTSGKIIFNSIDVTSLNGRMLNTIRPSMQAIFQDPDDSLDPLMTIGQSIAEPFKLKKVDRNEIKSKVLMLMERVGLSPEHYNRYPHQMSGGQNQRAVIARVLSINPAFIVADEPTASLDVSVQAQILSLLKDLKKEYGLTMLFISHDMELVRQMCDHVAVMYEGKIVEMGETKNVFSNPLHPYTRLLLFEQSDNTIQGHNIEHNTGNGCRFYSRCPCAVDACEKSIEMVDIEKGHSVLCGQTNRLTTTK